MSKSNHHKPFDPKPIIGRRYGRLTVTEFVRDVRHIQPNGHIITYHMFLCQCDCGGTVVTSYYLLKKGKRQSCGCLKREQLVERNTTHGLLKDPVARILYYNVYTQMIRRCYTPNFEHYKEYGGRGICICDEWYTPGAEGNPGFVNFYHWAIENGYERLIDEHGVNIVSIDRIDVDGNYEPGNCRWTTRKVQANNKTNTVMMRDIDGTAITRGNFATKYNLKVSDIRSRMGINGWSEEAILYWATHPELGMRKANGMVINRMFAYTDKEGFGVLIPSVEVQREMQYRRNNHGT